MYLEPSISFKPTSIAIFNRVLDNSGNTFRRERSSVIMPLKNAHNGAVSKTAAKNIRDKVNWLVQIAKKQRVKYPNGQISTNFRLAMITLTLPSPQMHPDKEIKTKCLNQFLVELRRDFGMQHYLWKAELQKNENIHFHLTTDTYIPHEKIKNIWNRIISKLGYVQAYSDKMRALSFEDYRKLRENSGQSDMSKIRKAWAAGNAIDWCSPNSTDVKTVFKVANLASYLAKYLAKELAGVTASSSAKERAAQFGGRLWYCSQTLSKLKSYVTIQSGRAMDFLSEIAAKEGVRILEFDYATCFYFDRTKFPPPLQKSYNALLSSYAKRQWAIS